MAKILGIDFGDRRIGLSLSDGLCLMAFPLEVYERRHYKKDVDYIAEVVKKNNVSEIVIGMPRHSDGNMSKKAEQAVEFSQSLEQKTDLKVHYIDERYTTVQGQRLMTENKSKKNNIDSVAASIILQTYLDIKKNKGEQDGKK